MKIFSLFSLILLVSLPAFSQEMKPLLAGDNSFTQAQAWLLRAIDKNSSFGSENSPGSISKVSFEGCTLSYEIKNEIGTSALVPGKSNGAVSANGMTTTLALDLKQMNINGVTLTPLIATSNMQLLTMSALGNERAVSVSRETGNLSAGSSGFRSLATMALRADVAGQVKEKLIFMMKVCQTAK